MTDIKRPPPSPSAGGLHGHAKRDFFRGAMTKHLVKGAAGGARGVDYQDFEAENRERAANAPRTASATGPDAVGAADGDGGGGRQQQQQAQGTSDFINYDAVQAPVVKDGTPAALKEEEKKKKKLQQQQHDPDKEGSGEDAEAGGVDVLAEPNGALHHQQILSSIARLLADPNTERQVYGAFLLMDPEQMKKTLGTPIRVAKHLLVLADRMVQRGQPRTDVLDYVAGTFLKLGPEFGKRAFSDYSRNIGIGSIYPLEVREKLVLADDKFLPTLKCRFTSSKRMLAGKVKETIVLQYPDDVTITEFAVKGGTRKGYQLVPMKEKGKHGLRFFEPGPYQVLIMSTDPMGFERMEEIRVEVTGVVEKPAAANPGVPRPTARFSFDRLRQQREAAAAKAATDPPKAQ
ncbi:MAG: hypothetical protein HY904_23450 [Deltaproteobacteria bacterium]|nr:hypothetical protein [Deltaproteobacteria bacterium]